MLRTASTTAFVCLILLFCAVLARADDGCLLLTTCKECVAENDEEPHCAWCANSTGVSYCLSFASGSCTITADARCPASEGHVSDRAVTGAYISLALGVVFCIIAFIVDLILVVVPIASYWALERGWHAGSDERAKRLRVMIRPPTSLAPFRFRMCEPNAASPEYPVSTELTPTVRDAIGTVFAATPVYARNAELCKTALAETEAMYEGLLNAGRHSSLHQNQLIALLLMHHHIGETASSSKCVYAEINQLLREHNAAELAKYSDFLYYLITGLRRLEKAELMVVYRQTTETVDLEQYRPGMPVCWASFTSASLSAEKAKAAIVGTSGEPGTLFVIRSLDARRLRLPRFCEEDEVVFEPNSEFTVKQLTVSHSFTSPHSIVLEQVPSTKPLLPPLAPSSPTTAPATEVVL